MNMRDIINILKENLTEGDVVKFPGNPNKKTFPLGANIYELPPTPDKMDEFTWAYIECLLMTETPYSHDDDDSTFFDNNFNETNINVQELKGIISDCHDFETKNAKTLAAAYQTGYTKSQAGHDFALTRNRHGAGFWDRGLGKAGDELTRAAHSYGECGLYLGDDGVIYTG